MRELFRTYPLLAGIGLTTGENMGEHLGGEQAFQAKENWVFATYGQGVLDAAKAEPGRQFRLIHRQHETRAQDIAATFRPVIAQPNVDFVFSFKYAQAHVLSSTTQTFHRGFLESLGNLKTLWTLRNDDALLFRWAAPDFVREFVRNIPHDKIAGLLLRLGHVGVGPRVPRRSFRGTRGSSRSRSTGCTSCCGAGSATTRRSTMRASRTRRAAFSGRRRREVLAAWQNASMIYPLVTGFHWADFDFQWYIEACRSRPGPARTASGFHSVETFITQKVHPGTKNLTIPQYVASIVDGRRCTGVTPPQVADLIDARADAALAALPAFQRITTVNQAEFVATFDDIADDGAARQVLRRQDPRRDRAGAVPRHARSAPPGIGGANT